MNAQSTRATVYRLFFAKNCTGHWLLQRFTAVLLIPLSYWLIVFIDLIATQPYSVTLDWLTSPLNAGALSVWIVSVFYHAALGLQVVIEDYVSRQPLQTISIRLANSVFMLLALVAIAALIKIILAR
jgi:succinate dehydrogenase / fumarate reductase membrane anchor subunit